MTKKNVGIFIFDDVEVLDFCGPFEVFSVTRLNPDRPMEEAPPFKVSLVAERKQPVTCRGGMRVLPDYVLEDCPELDILLIPGGFGTRKEMNNERVIGWIEERSKLAEVVASVCSGSILLGKAGLLEGKQATTHWTILDWMQELFPGTTVVRDLHFVEDGNVFTSAGISAGIDLALILVSRLLGDSVGRATAKQMEYTFPENNKRRIALAGSGNSA
jgi:transcriptional regulator GlxA family with amidase domain